MGVITDGSEAPGAKHPIEARLVELREHPFAVGFRQTCGNLLI
jgi:hypothetical protein